MEERKRKNNRLAEMERRRQKTVSYFNEEDEKVTMRFTGRQMCFQKSSELITLGKAIIGGNISKKELRDSSFLVPFEQTPKAMTTSFTLKVSVEKKEKPENVEKL